LPAPAIEALMDDLGRALAEPHDELFMLGGGNPALIPEVCGVWRQRLQAMLEPGEAIDRMFGVYDPPQGNARFVKAIASVLQRHLGRSIPLEQIAVTGGGQAAFFALFNLLAGPAAGGRARHIVLPIAPEYIGYRDQGFHEGIFRSFRPRLIERGEHDFRYAIDWDRLEITAETAAICVSRPTNPSGNLLDEAICRSSPTSPRSATSRSSSTMRTVCPSRRSSSNPPACSTLKTSSTSSASPR
jgi:valine--pyruvate aminotransferase